MDDFLLRNHESLDMSRVCLDFSFVFWEFLFLFFSCFFSLLEMAFVPDLSGFGRAFAA
jgi:hypothetical protein